MDSGSNKYTFKMSQNILKKRCFDNEREEEAEHQEQPQQEGLSTRYDALITEINANLQAILENQKTLFDAMQTIFRDQLEIKQELESLKLNSIEKPEFLAQTKSLREVKVLVNNVEKEVCRMTGENCDKILTEIASMLPFSTFTDILELDEKLTNNDYLKAMTTYIYKLKGVSKDFSEIFKKLFADTSLMQFNWNGSCEKKSLKELKLFENVMRGVFNNMTTKEFEDAMKKEVYQSHHRMHQKVYDGKKSRAKQLNTTI